MIFLKTYEFYVSAIKNKYMTKIAGIAIIIDNEILMLLANKHKNQKNKWSLPKGRIEEGYDSISTAYKELKEETGIKLINYIKKKVDGFKPNDEIAKCKFLSLDDAKQKAEFYYNILFKKYLNNIV